MATLTFPLLLEAVEESISQGRHVDGVLACAAGHRQNLIGVFSLDAVCNFTVSQWVNRSMRDLLKELDTINVEVPESWVADIDTPSDLARAQLAENGDDCEQTQEG